MSIDMDWERRRWQHGCHAEDPHLVDVTASVDALKRDGNEASVPVAYYHDDPDRPVRSVVVVIPRWMMEDFPHPGDAGHFQASVNHKLLDMGKASAGATLIIGPSMTARVTEMRLTVRMDRA